MITARVQNADKISNKYSVFLTFHYDVNIINTIKSLPERYWHPDIYCWEISIQDFKELQKQLPQVEFKIVDEEDILSQVIEQPDVKKEFVNIPKDYKFKTNPYEHQFQGVEYGLNKDRFILGDEQGLGKTMQVINIACIKKKLYGYKHCLIVCGVNGLKWNWQEEILKHSNEGAYILGTRADSNGKLKIGSIKERLEDLNKLVWKVNCLPYFIITNIETLRDEELLNQLKLLCDNKIIDLIAVDEFHKCKNPSSMQGKSLLKLNTESMIAITGTPLMNSPIDLYMPLKWLGYEDHGFYQFKNHYCIMGGYGGYQIVGYKNLEQLKNKLNQCTLRRLKSEVLDLPEKVYITEYVEMSPKQNKIYKEVKAEIKENIDMIKSAINPLAEMIRLRQATGYTGILSSTIQESAKFDRAEELIAEIVENGHKAILFSNWTSVINPLYKRLKKYNPALITGETKNRVEQQTKFMEDNSCKVILGTIGAMGTGLTLTAATTAIFLDEPWNRALREQAEDRIHRIGTKENVNIIFLICKNTIDERIHQIVEDKGAMADMLIDGKLTNQDKSDLVDFLLS